MFKKVKKKGKIITPIAIQSEEEIKTDNKESLKDKDNSTRDIEEIRNKIQAKKKKVQRGITIKPIIVDIPKKEDFDLPIEEQTENNIKKVFIPETKIKEQANQFLGVKRENEEKIKEQGRIGLLKMQKEIYTLPENLKPQITTQDDYVENLIKLSTAGIIDVPIPLESKMKNEEIKYTTNQDLFNNENNQQNNNTILNEKFGNVFINQQGRKMKFIRQREKEENKQIEQFY